MVRTVIDRKEHVYVKRRKTMYTSGTDDDNNDNDNDNTSGNST
jgi:hypothetical protein